ncbi:MAG: hypothetical protein ACRCWR_01840 [Saezia sp.]
MADMLWPTIGLLSVVLILIVGLVLLRSSARQDPIKSDRNRAQTKDMEKYIRQLKEKENEAWSEVMTVMRDDDRGQQTAYMNNAARNKFVENDESGDNDAPLSELQKAFFIFWKIPYSKMPATKEDGNRFIKAYKARLKADGYEHRVRRWERLEVLMGRFYSDYNVEELNEKCEEIGARKQILELLLSQTMAMLSKNVLGWRVIAGESAYQLVIKNLDNNYPKLDLDQYKRSL